MFLVACRENRLESVQWLFEKGYGAMTDVDKVRTVPSHSLMRLKALLSVLNDAVVCPESVHAAAPGRDEHGHACDEVD